MPPENTTALGVTYVPSWANDLETGNGQSKVTVDSYFNATQKSQILTAFNLLNNEAADYWNILPVPVSGDTDNAIKALRALAGNYVQNPSITLLEKGVPSS